jgi:hypothetical protein
MTRNLPPFASVITTGCNAMFGTTETVQQMKLFEGKTNSMDEDAYRERPSSHELKEALDSISDSDCKLPHYSHQLLTFLSRTEYRHNSLRED